MEQKINKERKKIIRKAKKEVENKPVILHQCAHCESQNAHYTAWRIYLCDKCFHVKLEKLLTAIVAASITICAAVFFIL